MRSGPRPRDGELAFLIARSVVVVVAPRRGETYRRRRDESDARRGRRRRHPALRARSGFVIERRVYVGARRRGGKTSSRDARVRLPVGERVGAIHRDAGRPRRDETVAQQNFAKNETIGERRCRRRRRRAEKPRAARARRRVCRPPGSRRRRRRLARPSPSMERRRLRPTPAILRSVRRRDVARFRRERVRLESERTSRDGSATTRDASTRGARDSPRRRRAFPILADVVENADAKHRRVRRRVDARLRVPLRRRRSVRTSILFHGMRLRLRHRRSRLLRVSSLRRVSRRRHGVFERIGLRAPLSRRRRFRSMVRRGRERALRRVDERDVRARGDVDPRREM